MDKSLVLITGGYRTVTVGYTEILRQILGISCRIQMHVLVSFPTSSDISIITGRNLTKGEHKDRYFFSVDK